ncbi:hypothetical protein P7K49_005269 [Saguinus oedipus]|uniref:Uncharacterized protein n=1 Tax=Saguinus oedipus TaxID=9490 RepID=A0ABQ9W9S6_SAGOE|nr:hypothetical protein P7K49_005269 [Saguinus oedipus]
MIPGALSGAGTKAAQRLPGREAAARLGDFKASSLRRAAGEVRPRNARVWGGERRRRAGLGGEVTPGVGTACGRRGSESLCGRGRAPLRLSPAPASGPGFSSPALGPGLSSPVDHSRAAAGDSASGSPLPAMDAGSGVSSRVHPVGAVWASRTRGAGTPSAGRTQPGPGFRGRPHDGHPFRLGTPNAFLFKAVFCGSQEMILGGRRRNRVEKGLGWREVVPGAVVLGVPWHCLTFLSGAVGAGSATWRRGTQRLGAGPGPTSDLGLDWRPSAARLRAPSS